MTEDKKNILKCRKLRGNNEERKEIIGSKESGVNSSVILLRWNPPRKMLIFVQIFMHVMVPGVIYVEDGTHFE